MGDPCGIGPELTAKLLADPDTTEQADIIVGARTRRSSMPDCGISRGQGGLSAGRPGIRRRRSPQRKVALLQGQALAPDGYQRGTGLRKNPARTSSTAWRRALDLCQDGFTDGMCFAPLNKEAMHLAGLTHEDESGFFSDQLSHRGDFGLLNTFGNLWTSRATSHVSHRQVSDLITQAIGVQGHPAARFGPAGQRHATIPVSPWPASIPMPETAECSAMRR